MLTLDTTLDVKENGVNYDSVLTNGFVRDHLIYSVEAVLATKSRLAQPRTWHLPLVVNYSDVEVDMDVLSEGVYGCLAGGATMVFLVQRYLWQGEQRTSIYLYAASNGLNSLTKVHHQIDSKLLGMSLATKETEKALNTLKII